MRLIVLEMTAEEMKASQSVGSKLLNYISSIIPCVEHKEEDEDDETPADE